MEEKNKADEGALRARSLDDFQQDGPLTGGCGLDGWADYFGCDRLADGLTLHERMVVQELILEVRAARAFRATLGLDGWPVGDMGVLFWTALRNHVEENRRVGAREVCPKCEAPWNWTETKNERPSENYPCPHARPSWRMCPHCLGVNAPEAPPATPQDGRE